MELLVRLRIMLKMKIWFYCLGDSKLEVVSKATTSFFILGKWKKKKKKINEYIF